jgi:hypothetical protein
VKTTEGRGDEARTNVLMRTLFLVCLAAVSLAPSQPAHPQTLAGTSGPQAAFALTIQDDLISLSAQDASLKAIIEEIGRRMEIPMRVEIPAAAKVTLAFERLALPEVLKRFGKYVNYGYVERWEQGKLRISAITVPSLKVQSLPAALGADASQQTPSGKALELEIDPRQFLKENRQ